ncbi:MAG: hypothetical protein MZU95_03470 [Desulfomicrobium escambiense]|nr:hypothetical protein [Desulfomicrobium escambiense]
MTFPINKTKIVATIGPASDSPEVLAAADPGRHERRAPQFLPRRFLRPCRDHRPGPGRGRGRRPPGRHHGRSARAQDAHRQIRRGAGPARRPARPFTLTHARTSSAPRQRVSVSFPQLPASVQPGRPAVPQRRLHRAGGRSGRRPGRRLPRAGRRRAAVAQGAEPARDRSRHQRLHRRTIANAWSSPCSTGWMPSASPLWTAPRTSQPCAPPRPTWATSPSSSPRSSAPAPWSASTRSWTPPTASWWRAATSGWRSPSRRWPSPRNG